MEKKIKFFLIAIVVVAVFFIGLGILLKPRIPKNIFCFLDIGTYRVPPASIEINSRGECWQVFRPNFDNLFMMSLFIPRQDLDRDRELYFRLGEVDSPDSELVVLKWKYNQIRFQENDFYIIPPDRESVKEGFHFHFQFPPLTDCRGKDLYFTLESPQARPGEGIRIGFWNDCQYYEALTNSELFINRDAREGFIAFRTYHTWQQNTEVLLKQIKARLLKDKAFLVFYLSIMLVVLLSIIGIFVLLIVKGRKGA